MVRSYVFAIKVVLQDIDVEVNEDKVFLSALTKACRFGNDVVRAQLPIQKT